MTGLVDEKQREAIRTRLDVSMLVEAAAGTGKTTSLVDRMVNLVTLQDVSPANLAAITFTVKAAAHLREKFQQALERAGRSDAVARIDRGFIGTTHAFCARLLRERPVEAALDPEFTEVDAAVARQLTIAFWNRWYDAALAARDPLIAEARDVGLDRKTLKATFERLVEHPDVAAVWQRSPRPDLAGLVARVMAFVDEAAAFLPAEIDAEDKFQTLIVKLRRLRESRDLDDDLDAQLQLLEDANHTSTIAPTQKRWAPHGKTIKALYDRYEQFVKGALRPEFLRWQEHVHAVALELMAPAVAEFAEERRREGTLTFQDLLVCARDMLRDHPRVRRYFQSRYSHLLVDEFQDTDPLQAEVMFYLTGADVEEREWRRLKPRPGSLFIVGDPKQSIYRFRRADITTYNEVKARMDEVVELSTNFRSAPTICTFVNDSFRTLFTEQDVAAGRQAAHIDLQWSGKSVEWSGDRHLRTGEWRQLERRQRRAGSGARRRVDPQRHCRGHASRGGLSPHRLADAAAEVLRAGSRGCGGSVRDHRQQGVRCGRGTGDGAAAAARGGGPGRRGVAGRVPAGSVVRRE